MYSERHALSAARLVFKTNKQNNGTTDLSPQFRHHISVVVISVCFAFAVKIKRANEMHTDRYNTVCLQLVCVFSLFFFFTSRGSSLRVKAVILGTQCRFFGLFLRIYFIVDISDCFPRSHSAVFLRAQDFRRYPNRLMCPSPARGAASDVRRVCLRVEVSTLIQTSLFSSHLSAPDVALGVKMDLCSRRKKKKKKKGVEATHFSACRK